MHRDSVYRGRRGRPAPAHSPPPPIPLPPPPSYAAAPLRPCRSRGATRCAAWSLARRISSSDGRTKLRPGGAPAATRPGLSSARQASLASAAACVDESEASERVCRKQDERSGREREGEHAPVEPSPTSAPRFPRRSATRMTTGGLRPNPSRAVRHAPVPRACGRRRGAPRS